MKRPPALTGPAVVTARMSWCLDGLADLIQDRRDLAAQEDEGDDGDDGDEGEDQRVLREPLALVIAKRRDELRDQLHVPKRTSPDECWVPGPRNLAEIGTSVASDK